MAKKSTTPSKTVKAAAPAAVATTTPVRNTTVPPKAAVKKAVLPTFDQIAQRAYFISQSGNGGNQDENWFRAEQELRGGI
ncbi:MAG TPA: DUF2934 domain-containing protein [Tepidisphaeraceae bacterium]|jgi:hypothetical protein|nr:DUF2934 domain-containing protein [Tepidisphaeraceae bacterium]